jgi:Uma2 family endonuclease
MASMQTPSQQRLILYGVSWDEYSRTLRALAEHRSLRLTYDRGTLELRTVSFKHESQVRFFDLLILALTLDLGLPLKGGGSTTFRRRRRQRGLEPDECYWIANESLVRDKKKIDLRRDPPPDLALEVDVSYCTLDRMSIYAALRVPEVWRYSGNALSFHALGAAGHYAVVTRSTAMPQVESADLNGLLPLRGSMDENGIFRQFQAWARQRFGGAGQATP